uniref:Transcription elongation factor 1 homolog n=1 Tax=Triticum urartu TaxID=4572 RepID=A0A8R7QYP4_TRIUA
MGKRKSAAKPPPKKRMDKLDTVFSCPFCNHGSSVECRIDMKNLIGEANCRICQESFSTTVNDTANGSMSASASTLSKMMMVHEHVWLQNEMVITTMTVMRWCYWLPPSAIPVVSLMADQTVSRQFILRLINKR